MQVRINDHLISGIEAWAKEKSRSVQKRVSFTQAVNMMIADTSAPKLSHAEIMARNKVAKEKWEFSLADIKIPKCLACGKRIGRTALRFCDGAGYLCGDCYPSLTR